MRGRANDKQFLELEKAFLKFDTDGNGYITKSELKKAMKELGEKLSKEELADMMNEGSCLIFSDTSRCHIRSNNLKKKFARVVV